MPAAACWTAACRPFGRDTAGLAHTRDVIQNAGSDTMVNLALAWAEEYAELVPEVSVEVSGGGSGTGIAALINGTVDLANSSRKIEPREIARALEETGREPRQFIVGYDALAVFVHRDNPLTELTLDQIGDIYREHGAIHRWSDLGIQHPACRRDRIIRVSRQSNSGTYHYFREAVLGKGADFKLGSLDLHGSKDVVELIARTPCAIGYSGMGYANSHVKALGVARAPGEPPVLPTLETTQDGSYPIARPLYMYTAGEPGPRVRDFMDWVFTDAGQRLVLESGYVPLRPLSQPSP
ncbi:MAG: phosphate ABC transporter substrate-binding protein [Verrucomicrobiae bacterium]|nr:phosphate ABC transporter substrate-binding protein [Verrucomicrobiae bacterium]